MDIEALVNATAEAVATLSALVEGLPRAMDAKLAAYTKNLDDTVRDMNIQFISIKATQAELAEQVKSASAAMEASLASFNTETRQIIADNLGVATKHADDRTAEVTALLITAEQGLVAMLESSQADAKALREDLGVKIEEVRGLLDGGLGAITKLEEQVPLLAPVITVTELRESLDHTSKRVTGLATAVQKVDEEVTARVEEVRESGLDLQERLQSTEQRLESVAISMTPRTLTMEIERRVNEVATLASTVQQQSADAVEAVRADLAQVPLQIETSAAACRDYAFSQRGALRDEMEPIIEGLQKDITEATTKANTVGFALTQQTNELRSTLTEQIEASTSAGRAFAIETANEAHRQATELLEKATAGIGERFNKVDEFIETMGNAHTGLVDGLETARAEAKAAVEAIGTELRAIVEETKASMAEDEGRLSNAINAVRQAMTNIDSNLREAIAEASDAAAAGDDKLEAELRGHIKASTDGLRAALETLQATVQREHALTSEAFGEARALIANKANADAVEVLAKNVGEALNRLEAMPPPVNATEMEVRLANKLVELIPEHTSLELPMPDIDATFNGNELTVTLTVGEKTVVAKRAIPMGLVYRGVYEKGEDYATGNFVTHKGSMWFAKSPPKGEPGKDLIGWQLAVKCGRDGKDAVPPRAYDGHETGRTYKEADFLRLNNRLWQCAVKDTGIVPEPGDISSTREWTLIGGVH